MKVLWLCNIMLPVISEALNEKVNPYGGWLSGLCDDLARQDGIKLAVCFPYAKGDPIKTGNAKSLKFFGYRESDRNMENFSAIIRDFMPDVIHIWGTEFPHSLHMVNAAEALGLLDKVVINIQGLVSIIGKYHYYCGLPESVCRSASLGEIKYRNNIEHGKLNFEKRGQYEIAALKKVKHVVGRTDWDEACARQVNPQVQYHFCNESLRAIFYQRQWDLNSCERHTIFLSQSNYPIKGFHLMLEAMPLILARFPDARVYTTGSKPQKPENWKQYLTESTYRKYIRKLIEKYHLEDHVFFTGRLDEKAMCEQYLKSNVFVSPSSIENSSNSIGEAMLLGMPVVSSDAGGVKNLMEHGKEGYIYQQDAPYMLAWYVCKVFEDEQSAEKMGHRAREHALVTHDREKNLRDMLGIYKEVLI